jgi:hypothetical protein
MQIGFATKKVCHSTFALAALTLVASCELSEEVPLTPEKDVHALLSEPTVLVACAGTGNVKTVTDGIAANCGGVSGCTNTTSTHNDLRLSGKGYCACYDWLWSKRNTFPYNSVQIFYHNAAAGQCGSNYHIHIEKKNGGACNNGMGGLWHMDIDTSSAESPSLCVNNDTRIDRFYNSSCVATDNKQSGVCVNPP